MDTEEFKTKVDQFAQWIAVGRPRKRVNKGYGFSDGVIAGLNAAKDIADGKMVLPQLQTQVLMDATSHIEPLTA